MKPRALLLTFALCINSTGLLFAQEWIGNQFRLDTALTLQHSDRLDDYSQLKCKVSDDILYFTEMKAFQHKAKNYAATICAINLNTLEQFTTTLPFPNHTSMKEQTAITFWVNDFHIKDKRIVVSVQDNLLIYNLNEDGICRYDTLFYHPRVKVVYIFNQDLYYLEEDHDKGYTWFRRQGLYGNEQEIRQLKYEAPHVVQANPNRYLFHTDSELFFLSTRYPVFEQYTLDGELLKTDTIDIPFWHPFEDEYIQKSLDVPYGVERIKATMGQIFDYSYPKILFPIGEDFLLYYTQYDTLTHKSRTQFAIVNNAGKSHQYYRQDTSTVSYSADRYPFNFLDRYADKARTSWRNKLIEICLDSDVDWHGLSPEQFKSAEEKYFKANDPKLKIRIQTYKNTPSTERILYDTDRRLVSLDELPGQKQVLLVNQALECSACRNELLGFLNSTDTSIVNIGIIYQTIPGVLQEYELKKSIRQHLTLPFGLYFLEPDRNGIYPRYIDTPDLSYPALLFHEKGKAPILFSTDQIFDENTTSFNYRDEFLKYTDLFFERLDKK